ncbi:hypothetical protein VHEMI01253 [[Torrubiella] hemipterigena]|uniref:Uncharacterized protein n=1 Tax=[Torrubiella] hemipterigena TaxID=1531966 RepID=A0A0A1T4A3_9HYPO|nr:hypothetical protein VHEMI01253 [[Torrubiella] hemipterigena]
MSEVAETKKVRREDLRDSDESDVNSDSDSSYGSDFEDTLNAHIAKALGIDHDAIGATFQVDSLEIESAYEANATDQAMQTSDDGYEFNLFSTSGGPTTKVVLVDPNEQGDGALVRPRPASYYKILPLSSEQREQFAFAALSGDDIYMLSRQRNWGLEMPWRVTTIKVTRRATAKEKKDSTSDTAMDAAKRKRPGKKTRITRRQKDRELKAKAEEAAKKLLEKEEHVRDKKKRMNRIKKLRKRAKEKEIKAAAGGGGPDGGDDDDDESDD